MNALYVFNVLSEGDDDAFCRKISELIFTIAEKIGSEKVVNFYSDSDSTEVGEEIRRDLKNIYLIPTFSDPKDKSGELGFVSGQTVYVYRTFLLGNSVFKLYFMNVLKLRSRMRNSLI